MTVDAKIKAMAERVDATSVGLDPLLVITIFTQILPSLIGCFQRNDEVSAEQASARVRYLHAKDPDRLLKRVAKSIRHESRKRVTRISKSQSEELARAFVAQALAESDASVADICVGLAGPGTSQWQDEE